nr:unnamed protein product [Spirometra erinaceieuropaei]
MKRPSTTGNDGFSIKRQNLDVESSVPSFNSLYKVGILTIRSPYSWWLSCPQLGRFISSYKTGLRKFKEVFHRARLKELLLPDLLRRNWKKKSSLGPLYILLDQLGSGAITKFETSSGLLLRLAA